MRVNNLQKRYGEKVVLDGVSLELCEGEITCILGRSGAGKTTLLNILAGLLPFEGEIAPMPKKVGYVFQESRLLPYLTVRENLLYAGGKPEWIDETLQKAGLAALADRKAGSLSGGEKRRVALLRAFSIDADLVLLDEPFSALDTVSKAQMLGLAWDLIRGGGKRAVFVTHDIEEVLMLADRVVVLDGGKITADYALNRTEFPAPYGEDNPLREKLLNAF